MTEGEDVIDVNDDANAIHLVRLLPHPSPPAAENKNRADAIDATVRSTNCEVAIPNDNMFMLTMIAVMTMISKFNRS